MHVNCNLYETNCINIRKNNFRLKVWLMYIYDIIFKTIEEIK